jgi:hypothetical protein
VHLERNVFMPGLECSKPYRKVIPYSGSTTGGSTMTLNEMLGAVVGQLQSQEQQLNAADPAHPTHGTDLLGRFQAAQAAAPTDPNADLGQAFAEVSSAMSSQGQGFTSRAYGDAFSSGAQAFAGRPNQLSANDLGPILGAITQGFGNHDTRGSSAPGPLAALAPLLGMLGGGGQQGGGGGIDLMGLAGSLLGGGGQGGGGLGGLLGGLMGGGQQQPMNNQAMGNQQGGGLGGLLGGLMGGGGQQGGGDILGSLLGAVQQGSNMPTANGHRDAGAASTGAVLEGILGAFLKR